MIDCSSWTWENCPTALKGIMVGKDKVPTLKMEIIYDTDLYVWNLFCGLPGSLNDINVLDSSPFFMNVLSGKFPPCAVQNSFGAETIDWLYFLADGIYPEYKIFATPIRTTMNQEELKYNNMLSAVRSSVERVFGTLLKQFGILARPGRLWFSSDMVIIMKACVIIHNMLVEERKEFYASNGIGGPRGDFFHQNDESEQPNAPQLTPIDRSQLSPFEELLLHVSVSDDVKNREKHFKLRRALVRHLGS